MPAPAVVTRLAPSPTGSQHLGNARTYLVSWLFARALGGRVLLRIEDIDSPRIKPHAAAEALADLRWLGLDWDGEPTVQTSRLPMYEAALARLKSAERVYPCTCTRSDIERAASAPHAEGTEPPYPGTCAHRKVADAAALDRTYAWRFCVSATPEFDDLFLGPVALDLRQDGGDFVVWKSAGSPAYQLAVVVDDAATGVTHVVRGNDLVASTPRQLLLYAALGLSPPRFAHLPLVVGPDGRRLAKRHGDTRLSAIRHAGVTPDRVIGLLAWSCGWLPHPKPIMPSELISRFELRSIPQHPFVLTDEQLTAIGYCAT